MPIFHRNNVKESQEAVLVYRSSRTANAAVRKQAELTAKRASDKLNIHFKHEINAVNAGIKARRGLPLSNPTRALNIARSSRNIAKLDFTFQIQAHNLVKFAQHAKYLGNGLAVIDFTSRIGNVRNEYKSGGNWERELFIESSSFALSTGTGILAAKAGLGLLVFATPFGWAGLIVGGIAVAGIAAAASMTVNYAAKKDAGGPYDSVIKGINNI